MPTRIHHRDGPRFASRGLAITSLAAAVALLGGCDSVERLPDTAAPSRAERATVLDVPRIMRGTVGSEVVVDGFRPVLLRGYGFVVGLEDSGCRTMPPDLLQHMEQELIRRGVGSERAGMGELSPRRMLLAPDTAVVIVEALLPPGAVSRQRQAMGGRPGTPFDVRVFLDPRTDATSLDGGRLYTCELRPVSPGDMLPPTGSSQAAALAMARGPIFVNPFAPEGSTLGDSVDRTRGRILDGGEATENNPIKLRLVNPSHARASIITQAINTRFPREAGMQQDTARGESDQSIEITVPISHRRDPDEFIRRLQHMTIRQTNPESVAATVARIATQDPAYATAASIRWKALGRKALPTVRDYYDSPDVQVRIAALEAGTALGDTLAVPAILEALGSEKAADRRLAVRLLGQPLNDPRIDFQLLAALDDPDVEVRLGAYESLNSRGSVLFERIRVGDRFIFDLVESEYPMVYVAQIGTPRIVLFGRDTKLANPLLCEMWGGRLILRSDPVDESVDIYFRPGRGREALTKDSSPYVRDLILELARSRRFGTEDPGLGLTYAETIGALYELRRQGMLSADFKAEQDRVQAAIARLLSEEGIQGDRPDFAPDTADETGQPGFETDAPALDLPADVVPGR